MQKKPAAPVVQALLAAVLFGASAPLSKILLGGVEPIPLAACLYLGSGAGALALLTMQRFQNKGQSVEARLTRIEIPWLVVAILTGGVAAPIILLLSLQQTPAATASLLLNFECVATALIAALVFRESIGRQVGWAVAIITLASLLLSWDRNNSWGFSTGALGIIAACFLWGLDNNATRNISAKNPLVIVALKGSGAGTFSLLLAFALGKQFPPAGIALWALLLGAVSYGLSIQLFILAMRDLGAARSSALFGVAPFAGALLSIVLFQEMPQVLFWAAIPIMLAGTWLMLTEHHGHQHTHELTAHAHRHFHADAHHEHENPAETPLVKGWHAHPHQHTALDHEHAHTPDLHHRH